MKISKISKIDNKNLKLESSLLFDGILVGLAAGIVGACYRLLIGYSEKLVHYTADFIKTGFIYKIILLAVLILLALFSGFLLKREPMASGRLAFTLLRSNKAKITVTNGVVQTMKLTSFATVSFKA